jgi:hypothetical protein
MLADLLRSGLNICNFSMELSLNSIQVDFVCKYGEIISIYEDMW